MIVSLTVEPYGPIQQKLRSVDALCVESPIDLSVLSKSVVQYFDTLWFYGGNIGYSCFLLKQKHACPCILRVKIMAQAAGS